MGPLDKIIVTVALTGSGSQWQKNNRVPITPEEIANQAVEAFKEGAAVAHVHVRNPATKAPDPNVGLYGEVMKRIRDQCDMVVQLTTGGGGPYGISFEQRMCALDLNPEFASLNVASMTFGDGVFLNKPAEVEEAARRMLDRHIRPEVECYDIGHIDLTQRLIDKGLLKEPIRISLVMGVVGGIPAKPEHLIHMMKVLPANCRPNIIAIGKSQFPILSLGLGMGADVRVGMEDNIYLSKGVLAKSNAELVNKIVRIAKELGKEIASPSEVRTALALETHPFPPVSG